MTELLAAVPWQAWVACGIVAAVVVSGLALAPDVEEDDVDDGPEDCRYGSVPHPDDVDDTDLDERWDEEFGVADWRREAL